MGRAHYVCALVQKMQALLTNSQDARSVEGGGATTMDVEEGGAKHGEGADQTYTQVTKRRAQVSNKKYPEKTPYYITAQCVYFCGSLKLFFILFTY